MKPYPITLLIPTYNEADNLKRLLPDMTHFQEILVVDSYSDDDTVEIARSFGARVIQRAYQYSASQKNWAIPQASFEWIFLLDADEWVEDDLIHEIGQVLAHSQPNNAYDIPRVNYYMGKRIRYSGWQNDSVIRLFKRDSCRYEDKRVHAEILTEGKIGRLKNPIHHNTYKNFQHALYKEDRYSSWKAHDKVDRGHKSGLLQMIFRPGFEFFKLYFLRLGILDGKPGFIICMMAAWSLFMRQVKIWRIHEGEQF